MLHTPLSTMLAALRPGAMGGGVMAVVVYGVLRLLADVPPAAQLAAAVPAGAVAYGGALWWLQRDVMRQAQTRLRAALNKG